VKACIFFFSGDHPCNNYHESLWKYQLNEKLTLAHIDGWSSSVKMGVSGVEQH